MIENFFRCFLANGRDVSYNYRVHHLTRGKKYGVASSNGGIHKSLTVRRLAEQEVKDNYRRFHVASTELFLQ